MATYNGLDMGGSGGGDQGKLVILIHRTARFRFWLWLWLDRL
jgi:hypothetical protein